MMASQVRIISPEGEELIGTLHQPAAPSGRGVVLAHCFTCSRHTRILAETAAKLADTGFLAMRFDFSGNGQSSGEFSQTTYSRHIDEIRSGIAFLRDRGADWIGLVGHSMGGMLCLLTAGIDPSIGAVAAIGSRYTGLNPERILRSAGIENRSDSEAVSFVSRGRQLTLTADFFQDAARHDLSKVLAGLSIPLLIVHGDRDEIIPIEEAHQGKKTRPEKTELMIVSGADHMFSRQEDRELVSERVAEWLAKQSGT